MQKLKIHSLLTFFVDGCVCFSSHIILELFNLKLYKLVELIRMNICFKGGTFKMKRIKIGVIGLGWFGEHHIDTFQSIPSADVTAVCTRRADHLKEIAKK